MVPKFHSILSMMASIELDKKSVSILLEIIKRGIEEYQVDAIQNHML